MLTTSLAIIALMLFVALLCAMVALFVYVFVLIRFRR